MVVCPHSVLVPHFVARVAVEGEVGRLVRHQVLPVNHPEEVGHLGVHVLGVVSVSHSRLPEGVHLYCLAAVLLVELDRSDDGNCASQTVPGEEQSEARVLLHRSRDGLLESLVGELAVGGEEAGMELALLAEVPLVVDLADPRVGEEVLDVLGASEDHHDGVDGGVDADNCEDAVAEDLGEHLEAGVAVRTLVVALVVLGDVVDGGGEVDGLAGQRSLVVGLSSREDQQEEQGKVFHGYNIVSKLIGGSSQDRAASLY